MNWTNSCWPIEPPLKVAQGQPQHFLWLEENWRQSFQNWNQKHAGKIYGDKQRQDVDNRITPGDKILLKNTKQSGKLAANFEPNPHTVQTKEGQELTC